ncbi:putative hydrolase, partial [Burkholderia sp. TJI49]
FRDASAPRSGQLTALGRDLLDFVDAQGLDRPVLVGHDWGARAVANACGLRDGVASHLVMLSVGYGTNDPGQPLSLQQARNYWYHWFLATPRGERALRDDRRAFARLMWDTWSPSGWYCDDAFDAASAAFDGPDWIDVVLHSYRHRWGFAPGAPAYADDDARLNPAPVLSVPTLVLHGGADACNHPDSSAGRERFFSGRYERQVLDGVGHFPQREAAAPVADAIVRFCGRG